MEGRNGVARLIVGGVFLFAAVWGIAACGGGGGGGGGSPAATASGPAADVQQVVPTATFEQEVAGDPDLAGVVTLARDTRGAETLQLAGQLGDETDAELVLGVYSAAGGDDVVVVRHCADGECVSAIQTWSPVTREIAWETEDGEIPVRAVQAPHLLRELDEDDPDAAVLVTPADPAWSATGGSPRVAARVGTAEPCTLPRTAAATPAQRTLHITSSFGGKFVMEVEFEDIAAEMRQGDSFSAAQTTYHVNESELDSAFKTLGRQDALVVYSHGDVYKKKGRVAGMTTAQYYWMSDHYDEDRMLQKMGQNPEGGPGILFFAGCRTAEMLPTFDDPNRISLGFNKSLARGLIAKAMKSFFRHFSAGKTLQEALDAVNSDIAGQGAELLVNAGADRGTTLAQVGDFDRDGCRDTCDSAQDGTCDDGGPGSEFSTCGLGTDCSDCGPRTLEFVPAEASARVVIDGVYSRTVTPGFAALSLAYVDQQVPTYPSLLLANGSTQVDILNDDVVLLFISKSLSGPGTYTMTTADFTEGDHADLIFSTGSIKHARSEFPVSFLEVTGTLTLTAYGTTPGTRLAGSFSATLHGVRNLCEGEDCEGEEELTGTINGTFDGTLYGGDATLGNP